MVKLGVGNFLSEKIEVRIVNKLVEIILSKDFLEFGAFRLNKDRFGQSQFFIDFFAFLERILFEQKAIQVKSLQLYN